MKQLFVRFYILLFVGFFVVFIGIKPIVEKMIEDEALFADRQLAKGVYYFISKEISGLDEKGIRAKINNLQPEFGYPLKVLYLDEVTVREKHQQDFLTGLIVRDEKENLHLKRVDHTDLVIVTGPYPLAKILFSARRATLGIITVILILPAGIWAFMFQRNLRKMERVTQKFVEGDHSARLRLPRPLPLKKIAGAFNHMAEQTQRLLKSREELVNSVSHEIRTPLARIRFSLEMLKGSIRKSPNRKDYAGEIEKDVEEISLLVDEILTYARFEGKIDSPGKFSEHEIISWLKDIVRREHENASSNGVSLKFATGVGEYMASFDPFYLGRVMGNLIRNALRHAESGVEIIFETSSTGCLIHLDDDGPGIPPEFNEKIFEPFFRLDQSRHRQSGGYGLGLAIAKRIVLWHKGTIQAGISPMNGARFTLEIPASG